MRKMTLVLALLLAGCDDKPKMSMTLPASSSMAEVLTACKECADAGMGARVYRDLDNDIIDVQCWPKEKP